MKRTVMTGLGWLLLVAMAAPLLRAADSDQVVVAGSQVGKLVLGMDEAQVKAQLGEPASSDGGTVLNLHVWYSKTRDDEPAQTAVLFRPGKDGKRAVCQVVVTSPYFHTQAGVSVRSGLAAIWQEFPGLRYAGESVGTDGKPLEMYDERQKGIAFLIEHTDHPAAGQPWGQCRGVMVHRVDEDALTVLLGSPAGEGSPK